MMFYFVKKKKKKQKLTSNDDIHMCGLPPSLPSEQTLPSSLMTRRESCQDCLEFLTAPCSSGSGIPPCRNQAGQVCLFLSSNLLAGRCGGWCSPQAG